MSVKDMVSNTNAQRNASLAIASNTTTYGNSLDTANTALQTIALMLIAYASAWTDGSYVVTLQDSPDNSTWTDIPAANYCNNTAGANGSFTISAAVTNGGNLGKLGVFGHARYVRPKVVSTGVTTGATLQVLFAQQTEIQPTV